MQIYKHRPLCLLISLLTAFSACAPFLPAATKLYFGLAAAGIFILSLVCLKRDRHFEVKVSTLFASLLLLFCVILRTYFFYDIKNDEAKRFFGVSGEAEIKIEEVSYSGSYMTSALGRMLSFCGEETNLSIFLECEYEADIEKGETVILNAKAYEPLLLSEDGYHTHLQILEGGYNLYLISEEDSIKLSKEASGISHALLKLNKKLSARFVYLLGDESGALSSGLVLGDESRFDSSTVRDFSRSGLAHILALSGSHIMLMIGGAEILLRKKFSLHKKSRIILLLLLLPIYVIFVNSPMPVVRAGIMYGVFLLAEFFFKRSDSQTNLFISLFLIVLIKPSDVFSPSLWMSFFATLALILFIPQYNKFTEFAIKKKYKRSLLALSVALLGTAMSASVGFLSNIIFMPSFGSVSLVSVPANMIFAPLLTVFLVLSTALVPLMLFPGIARIAAIPISYFGRFLLVGVSEIASYKYSVLSVKGGIGVFICVAFFAVSLLILIIKIKKKRYFAYLSLIFIGMLLLNSLSLALLSDEALIVNINNKTNEAVFVRQGDDFSLIDISNGRYSNLSRALSLAKEAGCCEIETLVLTHFHRYHVSSVSRLLEREIVRRVVLPYPRNDYDREIYASIAALLNKKGVYYSFSSDVLFTPLSDGVFIKSKPLERIKRSSHALISFSLYFDDECFTYVGTSNDEGRCFSQIKEEIKTSDFTLFGSHGPIQKQSAMYDFSSESKIYASSTDIREKLLSANKDKVIYTDKEGKSEFVLTKRD